MSTVTRTTSTTSRSTQAHRVKLLMDTENGSASYIKSTSDMNFARSTIKSKGLSISADSDISDSDEDELTDQTKNFAHLT